MGIRNSPAVRPHVDGGVSFEAERNLQALDRSVQRDGLFFSDHAASVIQLTAIVNQLTGQKCKVADMLKMSFNDRAKFARERVQLKPQQAAEAIGCSRPTVVRWENDAASIGSDNLLDAARVYKVRPDWLAVNNPRLKSQALL